MGIRLRHALFNPQVVYPIISDEEYYKILEEIRPNVWEAYCNNPNEGKTTDKIDWTEDLGFSREIWFSISLNLKSTKEIKSLPLVS